MPINPIQITPIQGKPLYNPELIMRKNQRLQQRHDKAVEAKNAAIEEALAKGTIDEEAREKYLNEINQNFEGVVDKYNNNLAQGYNDMREQVKKARVHPFRSLNQRQLQLAEEQRQLTNQYGPQAIVRQDVTEQSLMDEEGNWKSAGELGYDVQQASNYYKAGRGVMDRLKANVKELGLDRHDEFDFLAEKTSIEELTEDQVEKLSATGAMSGVFDTLAPTYAYDNRPTVGAQYDEEGNFQGNMFTNPEEGPDVEDRTEEGNFIVNVAGKEQEMTPEEYGKYKYIKSVNMDRPYRNVSTSYQNLPVREKESEESEKSSYLGSARIPDSISEEEKENLDNIYNPPADKIRNEPNEDEMNISPSVKFSSLSEESQLKYKPVTRWLKDYREKMDESPLKEAFNDKVEDFKSKYNIVTEAGENFNMDNEKAQKFKKDLVETTNKLRRAHEDLSLQANRPYLIDEDHREDVFDKISSRLVSAGKSKYKEGEVGSIEDDISGIQLQDIDKNEISSVQPSPDGSVQVVGQKSGKDGKSFSFTFSKENKFSPSAVFDEPIANKLEEMGRVRKEVYSPEGWDVISSNLDRKNGALIQTKKININDENRTLLRKVEEDPATGDIKHSHYISTYRNGKKEFKPINLEFEGMAESLKRRIEGYE